MYSTTADGANWNEDYYYIPVYACACYTILYQCMPSHAQKRHFGAALAVGAAAVALSLHDD